MKYEDEIEHFSEKKETDLLLDQIECLTEKKPQDSLEDFLSKLVLFKQLVENDPPKDMECLIYYARVLQSVMNWWGRISCSIIKNREEEGEYGGVGETIRQIQSELSYRSSMLDDGSEGHGYVNNLLLLCRCRECLTNKKEFFIDMFSSLVEGPDVISRADLYYYEGRLQLLYENYNRAAELFEKCIQEYKLYGKGRSSIRALCRYTLCCHKMGEREKVVQCIQSLRAEESRLKNQKDYFGYSLDYIETTRELIQ